MIEFCRGGRGHARKIPYYARTSTCTAREKLYRERTCTAGGNYLRAGTCTARENFMYGQRLAPCGTRDVRTVETKGRGLRNSRDADLVSTGAGAMPKTKFLDEKFLQF